jgi:hypothetical protein
VSCSSAKASACGQGCCQSGNAGFLNDSEAAASDLLPRTLSLRVCAALSSLERPLDSSAWTARALH